MNRRAPLSLKQRGVTLVELLVALTVGVLLVGAVIAVYLAQSQTNKSTAAQAGIQNGENAISALVTTVVRSAGFSGCATLATATSNLKAGLPPPLGNAGATNASLMGYDAAGTAGDGAITVSDTPTTEPDAGGWSPSLDASLVGKVAPGSDVLVVLGGKPGTLPVAVTAPITTDADDKAVSVADATSFSTGYPVLAVSDCLKTTVFALTAIDANTLKHEAFDATPGVAANAVTNFQVAYAPGAQAVTLQQTAFFVGVDPSSHQTVLYRALYDGQYGVWNMQSLVPGIETMQVLYGVAANGSATQYVSAGAVTDWSAVMSVRMAFLIAGDSGSAAGGNTTPWPMLGTSVTAPSDSRQRRVYEMTINLRNAAP